MDIRNIDAQKARMQLPPSTSLERQRGKIGWLLLWLVGIPVPVLIGLFLLRGCT